ncbi:MAG TPA: hypothetical protein VIY49_14525 [Bryobacteraceae bacterium]
MARKAAQDADGRSGIPLGIRFSRGRFSWVRPRFELDHQPYAEFSRVTVESDPVYTSGRRCGLGLIRALAHAAAGFGVDLVLSMCPTPMVRMNAINSRKLGVKFHPFPEISVPNPFGIPMILCAYTGLIEADCRPLGLTA